MLHAIAALLAATVMGNTDFDHSAFDRLLKAHVVDGMVDYDAFARASGFPAYLDQLARAQPETLSSKEQLAYWINVYNAYTIQLVNAHKERKSIRNINKTLGVLKAMGPWKEEMVKAGGKTMSLDHVEHEIIRKRFQEPRIHFALVCAARSCPPLRREAYAGERLDDQLDDQARIFIAQSPDKNRVDVARATAHLSPIFSWFKDDFGPDLGRFLARYVPDGPERKLLESGKFKIVETPYDWSLNSVDR
jgi:uncharacterized protein DUF547